MNVDHCQIFVASTTSENQLKRWSKLTLKHSFSFIENILFKIIDVWITVYLKTKYFRFFQMLIGIERNFCMTFFLPEWIYLGLNRNRFWFLNFKDAPLIWHSHFKFWCFSCQTFLENLRISLKDWQLSLWFSEKFYLYCKLLGDTFCCWRIFSENCGLHFQSFSEKCRLGCRCLLEVLRIFKKYLHP
jgi:hypothetical protein